MHVMIDLREEKRSCRHIAHPVLADLPTSCWVRRFFYRAGCTKFSGDTNVKTAEHSRSPIPAFFTRLFGANRHPVGASPRTSCAILFAPFPERSRGDIWPYCIHVSHGIVSQDGRGMSFDG